MKLFPSYGAVGLVLWLGCEAALRVNDQSEAADVQLPDGEAGPDVSTQDIPMTAPCDPEQTPCLGGAARYPSVEYPEHLVAGDFDGDGTRDLAASGARSNRASVYFGAADGTFDYQRPIWVGEPALGLLAVDLDGDGRSELLAPSLTRGIVIRRGRTDRTFAPPEHVDAGLLPMKLLAAHVDAGDTLDLLVAGWPPGDAGHDAAQFRALIAGPNGFVAGPALTLPSEYLDAFAVADLNGDGHLDVVAVGGKAFLATVLLGDGLGGFEEGEPAYTDDHVGDLAILQLIGGEALDLVVAYGEASLRVMAGRGDGTFDAPVEMAAVVEADDLSVLDFDGDGKDDLIATERVEGMTAILLASAAHLAKSILNEACRSAVLVQAGTPGLACLDYPAGRVVIHGEWAEPPPSWEVDCSRHVQETDCLAAACGGMVSALHGEDEAMCQAGFAREAWDSVCVPGSKGDPDAPETTWFTELDGTVVLYHTRKCELGESGASVLPGAPWAECTGGAADPPGCACTCVGGSCPGEREVAAMADCKLPSACGGVVNPGADTAATQCVFAALHAEEPAAIKLHVNQGDPQIDDWIYVLGDGQVRWTRGSGDAACSGCCTRWEPIHAECVPRPAAWFDQCASFFAGTTSQDELPDSYQCSDAQFWFESCVPAEPSCSTPRGSRDTSDM